MKLPFRSLLRRLGPSFRSGAAFALYHSGVLSRRLRSALDGHAVVLMYHRVLPEDQMRDCPSHPGIIVSTTTFELQMRSLRERFHILTVQEFYDYVESDRPFPPMSCLVTFDDGWIDNLYHALPILRKYGIDPLIFLAAGFVGTERRFWQESMTETIRNLRLACLGDDDLRSRIERDPILSELESCLVLDEAGALYDISRYVPTWKSRSGKEREEFIDSLKALVPVSSASGEDDRHFLDWEEVGQMQDQGVEFGSHGLDHRILTHPETDARREIQEADRILEQRFGKPVDYFSYPNGNFDLESRDLVRDSGYKVAFSTRRGHIAAGDDRFTLKRNNIYDGGTRTLPMFLARILGIW